MEQVHKYSSRVSVGTAFMSIAFLTAWGADDKPILPAPPIHTETTQPVHHPDGTEAPPSITQAPFADETLSHPTPPTAPPVILIMPIIVD